jgi:nuclear pore complex protein Nup98-Nup96
LFGAPAAAPAFGSPAAAPTSLFGAPAPAPAGGGLFGSTPAPAPVAGGLFGAPAPAPVGLFGAPAATPAFGAPTLATGGLFGAPAAAPAAGSLFGSPAPAAGTSLFGAPAPAQAYGVPVQAAAAPLVPPTADILLAQQIAAVENQNKELAVLQALRENGSFSGVGVKSPQTSAGGFTATSTFPRSSASVTPYRGLGMDGQSSYQKGPRSATKIRPRGFGPTRSTASLVIGNGNGTSTMLSPSALIGSSTKRLVIKKGALTPKPAMRLLLQSGSPSKKSSEKKPASPSNGVIKGREVLESGTDSTPAPDKQQQSDNLPFENSRITNIQAGFLSPDATATSIRETPKAVSTPLSEKMSSKKGDTTDVETPYDFYKSVVGSPVSGETSGKTLSSVPKLTKEGYITSPSIEELNTLSEADLAAVSNFGISREGFGRISWDGAVDVRGIDLDKVVAIDSRDIAVYDDEESTANKPPAGTKLNRPAVLTLQNIYPKDGIAKEKFEQKLIKKSTIMEADFISYDISTGEWKFRVHHFSRYGLDDDDDTDVEDEAIDSKQDFNSGARGGRVQDSTEGMDEMVTNVKRSSRIRIEDEDMFGSEEDNLQLLSDREDPILDAAQSAYDRLPHVREEEQDVPMEMDDENAWFEDDGESQCEYVLEAVQKPQMIPIPSTNRLGISAKIARKCGVKSATSSSTDFGMRFGRSFRVGWHPDGTLLHPTRMDNMHVVVRSRPVVTASSKSNETLVSDKLLVVQMKHADKIETPDGCPIFELNSTGEGKESAVLNEYEDVSRVESQSKDDELSGLLASAISLIHLENSKSNVTRRNCVFSRWLRKINEDDVKKEIRNGKDDYSGIFAALSGNNYDLAATIAREKGLFMLSLLLTNSSAMGADDLLQQIDLWENNGSSNHIPTNLMRIYKLLGRDGEVEEFIFKESLKKSAPCLNWKRRLAILEQCSDEGKDCEQFISSILSKYDSDVNNGSSPPPHSWYLGDKPNKRYPNSFVSCTLYRLLSLFNGVGNEFNDKTMTLSEAISPSGYTPFHHDVAISFHLVFVMNAVGASEALSERQEDESALLESYALQLVEHGKWEWAVYVALCSLTSRSPDTSMYQNKKRMAMDIFFRNYTDNSSIDEHAIERRYFLERKVGIPPVWFEEALSYRALQEWNPHSFVEHAFNYDSSCALRVYEDMILPDLLFNGGQENCQQIIDFLEAIKEDEMCDWKQAELSCAVYDFLEFSQNVIAVTLPHEASHEGQVSPNVADSITRLRNIQDSLSRLASRRHTCSTYFGNCNVVPRHVCIAEISRSLMMLESHLNSLLEGVSIDMEKIFGSSAPRRLNKKLSHVSQYWVPEEQKNDLFTVES